jgi:hypothetical protein
MVLLGAYTVAFASDTQDADSRNFGVVRRLVGKHKLALE